MKDFKDAIEELECFGDIKLSVKHKDVFMYNSCYYIAYRTDEACCDNCDMQDIDCNKIECIVKTDGSNIKYLKISEDYNE